jgi:hypothetical protein
MLHLLNRLTCSSAQFTGIFSGTSPGQAGRAGSGNVIGGADPFPFRVQQHCERQATLEWNERPSRLLLSFRHLLPLVSLAKREQPQ